VVLIPRRLASTVRLPLWLGCHRRIGKDRGTEALCPKRKPADVGAPADFDLILSSQPPGVRPQPLPVAPPMRKAPSACDRLAASSNSRRSCRTSPLSPCLTSARQVGDHMGRFPRSTPEQSRKRVVFIDILKQQMLDLKALRKKVAEAESASAAKKKRKRTPSLHAHDAPES
jgi:hypothetical protein